MHSVFWVLHNLDLVPDGEDWLGPRELRILAGLTYPKRRLEWRLGRWAAKQAVRRMARQAGHETLANAAFADLEILAAKDGAPEVFSSGTPVPVTISISHREGKGACAVGQGCIALGCDIEYVEPRSAAFVADYLTEAERLQVGAAQRQRDLVVATLWSAKESALKALRVGLRRDTRSVEVTLEDLHPAGLEATDWRSLVVTDKEQSRRFGGWWRRFDDHVITMAADPGLSVPTKL